MNHRLLPSRITTPPAAVRHAKLDNIALVPASMLPLKGTYRPIANKLPKGSVLICDTPAKPKLQAILTKVATFFRSHGRQVRTLSVFSLASYIILSLTGTGFCGDEPCVIIPLFL